MNKNDQTEMKKRFLFSAVLLMFVFIAGLIFVEVSLAIRYWQSPGWIWVFVWFNSVVIILYFEIAARFGPKRFESPIALFLKESIRDRVVISSAIFLLLTTLSIFLSIRIADPMSPLLSLIIYLRIFVPFVLAWSVLFFFGSENLRNLIVPQRIKEAGRRDNVVIFLGYFTQLIVFPIAVNLDPIWVALAGIFFIAFIPALINFIFGSPKLRDEVTPKWLKDIFLKIKPKGEK